jgi:hypothetical protein
VTEATARGKANRRKGHEAELRVCAWLRLNGFPHAERSVRTGFNARGHAVSDVGDITGTPGVVWQVKAVARRSLPAWLAETEAQRAAADAEYGVLVWKLKGSGRPAEWPAWLIWKSGEVQLANEPLAVVVTPLREMGFGNPLEVVE